MGDAGVCDQRDVREAECIPHQEASVRGSLVEPHTGRRLPLGTEEVREYIAGMHSRFEDAEGGGWWRTRGPRR